MAVTTRPPRASRTRSRRLSPAATAAAVIAAGALVAPLAPAAQATSEETHTLIVGTSGLGNIPHMNPLDSGWLIQGELNNLMYDPMIRWAQEDYSASPGLAVEWGPTDDEGLVWEYQMNPDATWSDGEPITAHDAAFTFNLLMENEVFAARHGSLVDNFVSVEAADDHTLVIETEEPSSLMNHLGGTGTMIMPEHVWGELDAPEEYFGEPGQPTSGAFTLEEFAEGERVVLTAVEDYWDGPVAYDTFILQNFETAEAMVQSLIAGEIDLIGGLNPQQFEALDAEDHIEVNAGQGRRMQKLEINTGAQTQDGEEFGDGHPALRDAAVRQAIHHVIDKERLLEIVRDGHGTPGVSIVPTLFSEHAWDPGDDIVEVSADIGNEILDAAGYDERNDDGVRLDPESGEPLEFRLFYHSDRPDYAIIKDFLVDWVAELDIVFDDIAMDSVPLNEQRDAGNFDIAFSAWNGGPDPSGLLVFHTCDRLPTEVEPTSLTFSFWCDEEYDELFYAQLHETDPDVRAEQLRELQARHYDQAPDIVMYYEGQLEAYNAERWEGFLTQPGEDGMIREQQGSFGYESAVPVGAATADDDPEEDGDEGDADDEGDDADDADG